MIRHASNPILTREHIISTHPSLRDVSSVFNPGGIMLNDRIVLLLRVQNRARETFILRAESLDGSHFTINNDPVVLTGLEDYPGKIYHVYDPRITMLNGEIHVLTAVDTDTGCYCAHFLTTDLKELRLTSFDTSTQMRNAVLFPDMINGLYHRFERYNSFKGSDGVSTGKSITYSTSHDLMNWENTTEVLKGNPHYWDELIGSGPPPLKTKYGWLHIYHGVATHFGSANIYQAGVSLHELSDPSRVIKRGKYNILEPRELYELTGQVPNVVFPSAAIPLTTDKDGTIPDGTDIYVYYGAADTTVCLAITNVKSLMEHLYA